MTRELTFGVIGLGFGANHARVLSDLPGARLAAVCDKDPQRLKAANIPSAVKAFPDYEAMLREEELDAVVVAVPARLHAQVALAAIAADCAVLVEKPLAPSLTEGEAIVSAARQANVALMPGHIERFNPALQELVRRVQAGDIGRVLQITARRMGAIRVPPDDVNVVHDSALHDIDAMRAVLGSEVEEVFALAQSEVVTPTENSISALLRFGSRHGAPAPIGSLDVNWLSPLRLRDLTVL